MSLHDYHRIEQSLRSVGDPVGFLINLFAHAPVGFAVWSADGKPLLTNAAFVDIFLVEPPAEYNVLKDELLARSGMLALFQRAFRGETVHVPTFWYDPRQHTAIKVEQGRRVAISMTIFPLFAASGKVEYVAATYKDETEVTLARERLEVSEERWRLAQQAAAMGTFEWNIQTGVNTWSPELEAMYGLEPGGFGATQQSWELLLHPDDREAARALVGRALETFAPVAGEWRVPLRDGRVRWLAGRFQALKDEAGQPERLIGVNLDITTSKTEEQARRQAELDVVEREAALQRDAQRAIERSEGRKAAVLEAALDAIVSIDHQGLITDFNPAAERMFDYPRSEALGKPMVELLIPASLREQHRKGFDRYLVTGVGPILGKRIETQAMRADGTEFPVELAVVPTRVHDTLFFTGYIRDISDRVEAARALQASETRFRDESVGRERAEVALRETEEQLRQSQKMEAIGTLAGSIAHDFNNILFIVLGYTENLLEELKADDPARGDVQQIATAGERGRHLTRQLLAFSRQQVLQPKLLNLNEAFSAMMQMLERLVGEDIELSFQPGPDLGAVRVDPGQIEQVLLNLVVNARDAMPDGGKLTVETSNVELDADYARSHYGCEPGSYVLLAVSDTGVGMDAATRARIFEPFFTTKEKGKGTGLGLSTVFGIVKQSGGTIWVYSEPGHGTTFKVYLPRLAAVPRALAQKGLPALSTRGSETVLLVEDDTQVRVLVATTLRKHGYRVIEAGNGTEALAIAERHGGVIDVLLSDVVMPGMGGRQLWERLAPRRPKMKVLFMSGYTNDAIVHHGVQKSELAFIQKPIVPRALLVKLRQVLGSPRASRSRR